MITNANVWQHHHYFSCMGPLLTSPWPHQTHSLQLRTRTRSSPRPPVRAEKGAISWDYSLLIMLDITRGAARWIVSKGRLQCQSERRINYQTSCCPRTCLWWTAWFNSRIHKTDGLYQAWLRSTTVLIKAGTTKQVSLWGLNEMLFKLSICFFDTHTTVQKFWVGNFFNVYERGLLC